jgi:single-strand DNA-binding protein
VSRGFSRVVLVGNLGRDPEMRYSQNGTPITNFTIAVNRRRRGPDGSPQDETDWYRISLFRQQAENAAEWLRKGNKVLVEGQLQIRTYTGQDGVERTSVEVNADSFMNLTARDDVGEGGYRAPVGAGRQEQGPQSRPAPQPREDDFDDLDDVPF